MLSGKEFLSVEDNYFPRNSSINVRGKLFTIDRPQVMGILNITPDSFYQKSRYLLEDKYLETAGNMLNAGASILDIGGYSTRPGATDISVQEEIDRVVPAIEVITAHFPDALISIDTFRSAVAKAAVEAGAGIVNDISGGRIDDRLFETVGKLGCPYILMHSKGTPQTMQHETTYDNLFKDVARFFSEKTAELQTHGVQDIILDPGFGFAKTVEQNYELLERLADFHFLGFPLLVGVSRKSMIHKKLGITAEEALNGTTILNTLAITKGASILRVHDVKEAMEIVQLIKNPTSNIR